MDKNEVLTDPRKLVSLELKKKVLILIQLKCQKEFIYWRTAFMIKCS